MGGSAMVSIVAQERREVREGEGLRRGAGAPSVKVSIVRVLRHQGRPSASSQRQHTSSVTKHIVKTAVHIAGTTDVSTPAGVALYAGSIAVAGAQVGSTPSVSREVFLSHTSRCSVQFSSARGGGRGRGGARSAARRGVRRVSEWAKALAPPTAFL